MYMSADNEIRNRLRTVLSFRLFSANSFFNEILFCKQHEFYNMYVYNHLHIAST